MMARIDITEKTQWWNATIVPVDVLSDKQPYVMDVLSDDHLNASELAAESAPPGWEVVKTQRRGSYAEYRRAKGIDESLVEPAPWDLDDIVDLSR